MQQITDLPFMGLIGEYGAPDYFFTEYFRVHPTSRLEKHILRSVVDNRTGRPVFAQLMGQDPERLAEAARELHAYPIAGIDLNMGCPAPMIYKGNVGGGLLRDPDRVDQIIGALRDATPGLFTVKMRIGFDSTDNFQRILGILNKHGIDLLSVHGRTVQDRYFGEVKYGRIAEAVRTMKCPVLANGNVTSALRATAVLKETGAFGVMLGRHAIRNPWVFRQCRQLWSGQPVSVVTHGQVRQYIERLYRMLEEPNLPQEAQVSKAKRYLNFIGISVDPQGGFLFEMRRAHSEADLFAVCDKYLLDNPDQPFALEPYSGLSARPNSERKAGAGAPAQWCG
ncbi:MAG TPA: tRNA-dihydrouridine synthase family protein [Polyangiaceae bacterium]|nr:tRNA-dihydrouridine synthase family protein [Polyangiaceae bacterium]